MLLPKIPIDGKTKEENPLKFYFNSIQSWNEFDAVLISWDAKHICLIIRILRLCLFSYTKAFCALFKCKIWWAHSKLCFQFTAFAKHCFLYIYINIYIDDRVSRVKNVHHFLLLFYELQFHFTHHAHRDTYTVLFNGFGFA